MDSVPLTVAGLMLLGGKLGQWGAMSMLCFQEDPQCSLPKVTSSHTDEPRLQALPSTALGVPVMWWSSLHFSPSLNRAPKVCELLTSNPGLPLLPMS